MENKFVLHDRLQADSFFVKDLGLCECRLINNSHFAWLLLVPKVADAEEIIDLSEEQQRLLLAEINQVSRLLKKHFPCDKLNVAAIGNFVRQLHVHVVARTEKDVAWPDPVWGAARQVYQLEEREVVLQRLKALL